MKRELIKKRKDLYKIVQNIQEEEINIAKTNFPHYQEDVSNYMLELILNKLNSTQLLNKKFINLTDLLEEFFTEKAYFMTILSGKIPHIILLQLSEGVLIDYYIAMATNHILKCLNYLESQGKIKVNDVKIYFMHKEHGCLHKLDNNLYYDMLENYPYYCDGKMYRGDPLSSITEYTKFVNSLYNGCSNNCNKNEECSKELVLTEMIEIERM